LRFEGFFAREVEIARHLHGDGRGALSLAATHEIDEGGANDALHVDAGVLVEALVLGGEDGLLEVIWYDIDV